MKALLAACKPLILLDLHRSFNDTPTKYRRGFPLRYFCCWAALFQVSPSIFSTTGEPYHLICNCHQKSLPLGAGAGWFFTGGAALSGSTFFGQWRLICLPSIGTTLFIVLHLKPLSLRSRKSQLDGNHCESAAHTFGMVKSFRVWYVFIDEDLTTIKPNDDNTNHIILVGSVFGFIIS